MTRKLIATGYFPPELPPPFTSAIFARRTDWFLARASSYPKLFSYAGTFSIPKIGQHRRLLAVTNPLHQLRLANKIATEWRGLNRIMRKTRPITSLGRPVYKQGSQRVFERLFPHDEIANRYVQHAAHSRAMLKTDLTRFYASVYTHALGWALHGKQVAKRQQSNKALLGNQLDILVRATSGNQTIGIPIGPLTSAVLAELIAGAVDDELVRQIPAIQGFRYVDDYYLFFQHVQAAEHALGRLQYLTSQYQLELNPFKTVIHVLPFPIDPEWILPLRTFRFSNKADIQRKDLTTFFARAWDFAARHPDDAVLSYALQKAERFLVRQTNWSHYQSLLIATANLEGATFSTVARILVKYEQHGLSPDRHAIRRFISDAITRHAGFGNNFEISWAIWLSIRFRIVLPSRVWQSLAEIDDPVVALLVLDARERGLCSKTLNFKRWMQYLDGASLYQEHWRLAYEAAVKGWPSYHAASSYVAQDTLFRDLQQQGVTFYDPKADVKVSDFKHVVSAGTGGLPYE